jgi:hypothetical protein
MHDHVQLLYSIAMKRSRKSNALVHASILAHKYTQIGSACCSLEIKKLSAPVRHRMGVLYGGWYRGLGDFYRPQNQWQ